MDVRNDGALKGGAIRVQTRTRVCRAGLQPGMVAALRGWRRLGICAVAFAAAIGGEARAGAAPAARRAQREKPSRNSGLGPVNAIQYVSPSGKDSNDGLSWATAVADIYTAWNHLDRLQPAGGTIYVAPNSSCGSAVNGMGIWSMNSNDPNWNSGNVPPGWVRDMPVQILGVGTKGSNGNAPTPGAPVQCGSGASPNLPAIWISGNYWPKTFENLDFAGSDGNGYQAVRLGIDSDGKNTNTGAAQITFRNDQFAASSSRAGGPTIEIGSNVFEDYWENDYIQADAAAPGGTGRHQAMVVNANPIPNCNAPGLLSLRNIHLDGGGLRFHAKGCRNSSSLFVDGLLTENQNDGKGAIWFDELGSSDQFVLDNIAVADSSPPSPDIEVDPAPNGKLQSSGALVANQVLPPGVPGTFLGANTSLYNNSIPREPSASGQTGFLFDKVWGQTDAARRLFGLTESRWQNKAPFLPSSWTGARETAVSDPSGTRYAGQSTGEPVFADFTQTFDAGDFVIIGAWYMAPTKIGLAGLGSPIQLEFISGGCLMQPIDGASAPWKRFTVPSENAAGDGQWTWASGAFVVTSSGTCEARFSSAMYNRGVGVVYYAPVMYVIPGSMVSSYSEIADEAMDLAPYAYGLANLSDSTLPGHPLSFGGSGDSYLATLDHTALKSNQTYTLPAKGGTLGVMIGDATVEGPTSAIAPGGCARTIATRMDGVTAAMTILATPEADPAAAGYGRLSVYWFATAGQLNLEVCNPSRLSVTPRPLRFSARAIE
jgi:hypothetical protein